jgi:4-aminobutyrate aminotransferase-like enzyme
MADVPVLYPKWQPQITAAIDESDAAKLLERVREIGEILSKRLDRISGSRSHSAEIQAIEQAMDVLEVLKRRARQPKAS